MQIGKHRLHGPENFISGYWLNYRIYHGIIGKRQCQQ